MNKDFLRKISPVIYGKTYLIPEPKLSPERRKQRRLACRNENILYKRKSSLSGENIISFFNEKVPYKVFTHDEWWSDVWNPMNYGRNFDFNLNFFDQFNDLVMDVPRVPLINNKAENSPYCNFADGNKNCHMVTSSNWNQDCFYSFIAINCKDSSECVWCVNGELLYSCTDCTDCYNLKFSQHCANSSESAFLYDCIGVKKSLFCVGLRNAEYHIFNAKVSKEEFEKQYNYYFCGSHERLEEAKKIYDAFRSINQEFFRKDFFVSCENVSGNNIWNSKNIESGFDIYKSQDCSFVHDGLNAKDCSDICFFDGVELCYESTSLIGYGYRFTNFCRDSVDLFYCDSCHSCKNCFGCAGLRNKEFCIFNKQYSQENYFDLMRRIIQKMMETAEWGEFFPEIFSVFSYNETLANDYFPLTKEQVLEKGWKWFETEEKQYSAQQNSIPDSINDIPDSFCENILSCEASGKNYKVIPQELRFYKKMKLPIPRKCADERRKELFKER